MKEIGVVDLILTAEQVETFYKAMTQGRNDDTVTFETETFMGTLKIRCHKKKATHFTRVYVE